MYFNGNGFVKDRNANVLINSKWLGQKYYNSDPNYALVIALKLTYYAVFIQICVKWTSLQKEKHLTS